MYKLLIADDEDITRNGLMKLFAANENLELCTPACNGSEAYITACEERPDIIITDIRMPEVDGLNLIGRLSKEYPDLRFIIISGYGEFEYAKQAMTYGVKHFILKPCNDKKLKEAVNELIEEIDAWRRSISETEKLLEDFQNVLPQFKEQFIRDYISGRPFEKGEAEYFQSLPGMNLTGMLRTILFDFGKHCSFKVLFALKKLSEDTVFSDVIRLCTIISGKLFILTGPIDVDTMLLKIRHLNNLADVVYGCEPTVAYGAEGTFNSIYGFYNMLDECLMHSFYLGKGAITTPSDMPQYFNSMGQVFSMDTVRLKAALKNGSYDNANEELDRFFNQMLALKLEENTAKTYCFELFAAIASTVTGDWLGKLLPTASTIASAETLNDVINYLRDVVREICKRNKCIVTEYASKLTRTIITYVAEHIGDEELSLKDIANNVLYMNEDYVGRLFKKEMNEKFSQYLLRNRMELAEKLIRESADVRIFEIANYTGYGSNPQNFSIAFKKHTGYTPTEYKKMYGDIIRQQSDIK